MDVIEGHPIPQDITGFQFRIIGDLTIKQFAYLAVGLLLGWVCIAVSLPLFLKIPLAVLFAGTGIIFAFVPIQGRTADTMILLFIKAVLRPNEYTYQKGIPGQSTAPIPQPLPASEPMEKVVQTLTTELAQAKKEEQQESTSQGTEAHTKVLDLENQLANVLKEKQELEKRLLTLEHQTQVTQQEVFTPTPAVDKPTEHVKTIPQELKKATGIPIAPDAPNLVLGVVKDSRGNILPNILIEVKDTQDNPVRAFKTNPLGQFASATPLLNGTYTITFDDPKKVHQFEAIKIVADGSNLSPLEVTSVDERENLRKSLFGG